MNIFDLIESARQKAGTLGKMAEMLGKHQNRITEWRQGRSKPSASEIAHMASIAGLPILETVAEIEAELHPNEREIWKAAMGELKGRRSPSAAPVKIGGL